MPGLDFKGDVLKAGIAMGINGKCSRRRKRPSKAFVERLWRPIKY
jgi:hypothetical protein